MIPGVLSCFSSKFALSPYKALLIYIYIYISLPTVAPPAKRSIPVSDHLRISQPSRLISSHIFPVLERIDVSHVP